MPMLTPSRLAIAVLSLSLLSFLWTFGFPSQLAQPSRPVIDHYDHKNVHSEPIIPAPSIPEPTGHAILATPTGLEDDQRWNDETKVAGEKGPKETGITEYEEDGGRWEDKEKLKDGQKAGTTLGPTTLSTAVVAIPSGLNATNEVMPAKTSINMPLNTAISKFCKDVHGAPNVMVIFRTSKAEITEKLPAHIKGLLTCVPNFAIFSDHAGEIEGITVHNALDSIGSETKRTHDEFREYQIIHADSEHKPDKGKTKNLDKWKFLPMVYKAYHLNPSARFYVFIEADTSLSWTNLLQWVDRLDYRIPYYSGAPTILNSIHLAQRGAGILLSQGALRRYAKSYDELYTSKWEPALGKGCCGDLALATALADAHVEFYASWPLLQAETPASLDFTQKNWCVPAVSWHHTNGALLEDLWTAQKNWTATHGWSTPFLFRDAFDMFVMPHIEADKNAWDNLAQDAKVVAPAGRQKELKDDEERRKKQKEEQDDKKKGSIMPGTTQFPDPPHHRRDDPNPPPKELDWDKLAATYPDAANSPSACARTCELARECVQWRYKDAGDGECHLGKVLRLGREAGEKDEKWSSGWMVERVEETVKGWECKGVKWEFYQ
jgi:hypothetical protein